MSGVVEKLCSEMVCFFFSFFCRKLHCSASRTKEVDYLIQIVFIVEDLSGFTFRNVAEKTRVTKDDFVERLGYIGVMRRAQI